MRLRDRVAIVTGAARGLGRAIVLAYVREGAAVLAADIDAGAAENTARLAREAGGQSTAMQVDVSDAVSVDEIVRHAVDEWGRLDIMVAAAGIQVIEPLLETTAATWERMYAVNTLGVLYCVQAAGRVMLSRGSGRIITVTSAAARMAVPNFTAYAASKAGVECITRAAAAELAPHGLRVNSISPGRMLTDMTTVLETGLAALAGETTEEREPARIAQIPVRRKAAPEEVAAVAVWLASDEAEYINGCRLNATGGLEMD
ncbi:MAG: SDR family NAD(P)-dependent oxidoreductase [Chloroflexota bacterium]|nr:MAG: short-chain dehydrogenase [Chloroflexota bacterium]